MPRKNRSSPSRSCRAASIPQSPLVININIPADNTKEVLQLVVQFLTRLIPKNQQQRVAMFLNDVFGDAERLPRELQLTHLRDRLSVDRLPSQRGKSPKHLASPWVDSTYSLLIRTHHDAKGDATKIRRLIEAERSSPLTIARLAREFMEQNQRLEGRVDPEDKARAERLAVPFDQLLALDIKAIAASRRSAQDFALTVLRKLLAMDDDSDMKAEEAILARVKRARRRVRARR